MMGVGRTTVQRAPHRWRDDARLKASGAYARAIERLRSDVNKVATLWVIAHTGHSAEEQHRPKGSTNLLGAYDTFPRFKKVGEQRGEIEIMIDRDASSGGMKWAFEVESYDTGAVNENGEPVIPVIKPSAGEDEPCSFTFREPGVAQTTDGEKEALRALTRAIQDHGLVTPEGDGIYAAFPDQDIPPGEVTVSTEAWRTTFYKLDRERSPDAGRKAFNRALDGLVKKGLVAKVIASGQNDILPSE